jgi:hypothetical protein
VVATLAVDGKPIAESVRGDIIARSIEHWRVHRFGLFSFRLCANGAFAGYSGIKHTAIEGAMKSVPWSGA